MKNFFNIFNLFFLMSVAIGNLFGAVSIEKGLSYDDVLLVPKQTHLSSRNNVSTTAYLTKKIKLTIPVISANMDSITESDMAIAMALEGGIGIIHRNNTIEEQVKEIDKVKRYRNAVIEHPLHINQDALIHEAQSIMTDNAITSLLVIDESERLVGIVTARDMRFIGAGKNSVSTIMTKKENLIVAPKNISHEEAIDIFIEHSIEKLPLINEDETIAGLMTSKDIAKKIQYPNAALDDKGRLLVGAAIGIQEDALPRARALVAAGVDVLVIDVAHGHSDGVINLIKAIKQELPHVDIIAGNVATAEGTLALIKAGAAAVKVGIGPGSICITRKVTGCGYPQLSAIINCAQEADKYGIPVIADGGIKTSGDIPKAIAAGASTVMLGNLLAATKESPGTPFIKDGKRYKALRGMASLGTNFARQRKSNQKVTDYVEGVEAFKPYKGSAREIIRQLMNGLRSGMSYCGVTTLESLRGNGHFVQITTGGIRESGVHDVQQFN